MQRFPRRIRVPSRRIQEANQAFEIYEDLETCLERLYTANPLPQEASSTSHSISEQALSTPAQPISTNNSGETTISQPTTSRRSSRRVAPTSTAEISATSTTTQVPPHRKIPLKLPSVLNQSKSARQLRQDPATALFPMLAKPTASWDNDDLLKPLESIPDNNPFANGALPAAPPIPKAVTMKGYYTHPEFSPIPRRIHEGEVNLPGNLTDPIRLFTLFYPRSLMETFVRAINKYAEEEIELERREISEFSIHNRYLDWKPLTTRETYIFLRILILISSDRRPKFKDY
jgi:hypothetical protein